MALAKKLEDYDNALLRLEEAYRQSLAHKDEETFSFFRDSTIQRFEFTLEIAWKSIKSFLYEIEGIECRSPKACIRDFLSAGYLDEWSVGEMLVMVDDRNLATHTYHEALADRIFENIAAYLPRLRALYSLLASNGR
jgi:nucleotidyltransferase substrate binding protein (TIGR01987 family)